MKIGASTRLFALLGQPVSHSLSPRFQNAGFLAAGLDACYVALACATDQVPVLMTSLAANGGGGNVTVPHKSAAARAGVGTDRVRRLGAANVFVGRGSEVHTDNTDVDGILHSLDGLGAPAGNWLIIGTGGSARAVAGAALERGAAIAVQSRSPERRREFLDWAATIGVGIAEQGACSVAVNATPLGLGTSDALPLKPSDWPELRWALDLVYRSEGTTPWIDLCRGRGLAVQDGREMLLAQGAASWRLWFPGIVPPLEVMRAALHGRLG